MKINNYYFESEWKHDIQDKDDFDINVLQVSTRYYGRDNTAKPTIWLGETKIKECEGYIQGNTETETKQLAEKWIKREVEKLVNKIIN